MSVIVLWKHTRVGAWVKIKMSGGKKNTIILYIIINCHARVSHKAGIPLKLGLQLCCSSNHAAAILGCRSSVRVQDG